MYAAFVWAIIFVVFALDLLFALNQLLQFLQVCEGKSHDLLCAAHIFLSNRNPLYFSS